MRTVPLVQGHEGRKVTVPPQGRVLSRRPPRRRPRRLEGRAAGGLGTAAAAAAHSRTHGRRCPAAAVQPVQQRWDHLAGPPGHGPRHKDHQHQASAQQRQRRVRHAQRALLQHCGRAGCEWRDAGDGRLSERHRRFITQARSGQLAYAEVSQGSSTGASAACTPHCRSGAPAPTPPSSPPRTNVVNEHVRRMLLPPPAAPALSAEQHIHRAVLQGRAAGKRRGVG